MCVCVCICVCVVGWCGEVEALHDQMSLHGCKVVYPPFVSCVRFMLTCEIDTLADSVCPFGKGAEET